MTRQINAMLCFFLLSSPLFISSPARGSDFSVITEPYPPFNYEEGGIAKGLSVEVVSAAFKTAGLALPRIRVYPWGRAYQYALKKRNVFIFGMIRNEARENLFKWIGPITATTISLFKLAKRHDIQLERLEDAKKFTIGAVYLDAKATFLEKNGFKHIQYVPRDRQNYFKLLHERFDLAIWDDLKLAYFLDTENLEGNKIVKALDIEELSIDIYLALSKNSDDGLARQVRCGLEKIKRNGVYRAIHKKYTLD